MSARRTPTPSVPGFLPAVVAVALSLPAGAQGAPNLIVNGDFENVVGSGCMSNLVNSVVGTTLPTLTAFGSGNEMDVYVSVPCYGLPAYSGVTKACIATKLSGAFDAFSFSLTSPIPAGTQLTLTFHAHAVLDFSPGPGTVEIGMSDAPATLGIAVHSVALPSTLAWAEYTATFGCPIDAQYLTVRAVFNGTQSWSHLDDFVLVPANTHSFCAGDGTHTPCPCGNDSAIGADTGCVNSHFLGGRLRAHGIASLATDSIVLDGDQMPNSSALYLQGLSQFAGGAGAVFGDGLRCAGGAIIRLGIAVNAAGASHYPNPGQLPVSVRGTIAAPGMRTYQAWYRDVAPFCTPYGFNLTNGIEVTWGA